MQKTLSAGQAEREAALLHELEQAKRMQAAVEGEHARLSAALQAEQSLLTAATQRGEDSAAAQVPLRQQAEEAKGVVAIFAAKLHEAQAHLAQKDAELGDLRAELLQLSQARTLPSRAAVARTPWGQPSPAAATPDPQLQPVLLTAALRTR